MTETRAWDVTSPPIYNRVFPRACIALFRSLRESGYRVSQCFQYLKSQIFNRPNNTLVKQNVSPSSLDRLHIKERKINGLFRSTDTPIACVIAHQRSLRKLNPVLWNCGPPKPTLSPVVSKACSLPKQGHLFVKVITKRVDGLDILKKIPVA